VDKDMYPETSGLLSPYRVLDLTDEKGIFCAKILADMGADVIAVEPPGGSSARRIGPFYGDMLHPEKSLFWFSYSANKRGVTLDLQCEDGRTLLGKLVSTADVVVESFPSGHLNALNLGFDRLCEIKPDIIVTSITPFGQDGPYKDFNASDLVCWSMGGFTYITGDSDRPPVQISFPQAFLMGSNEAAVGTMVALYHRDFSGEGQHVDVSIQASVAKNMMNAPYFWQEARVNLGRAGPFRVGLSLASKQRVIWKCKDGEVAFFFWGGMTGVRTNKALVQFMDEKGMASEFIKGIVWQDFDSSRASDELFEKLGDEVGRFFLAHTKEELFREAVKRRMTLYPVQTVADIVEDQQMQLQARGFWTNIEHPELETRIPYPNTPTVFSEEMKIKRRRAPFLGEHNEEIFVGELGLSKGELIKLKESGAI
jgi:crotonobetainyl-CoA:carnitine CoA-transferase CaiB-like acyl-CoA transferase